MPQAANIVINDGATTPVAHTFTPIGKDEKGVLWFEQTNPVPTTPISAKRIGYRQQRSMSPVKGTNGKMKAIYTLYVPTPETLANNSAGLVPPPTVAYTETARLEFDIAERSGKQERKDTRVLMSNLMAHAMMVANVDDMQPSYA